MRTFAVLLFITLTVITMSPSNLTFAGEKGPEFGKVTDAEWQLSFPPKYPEANAIIVFDRCSLMVGPPSDGSGIEIRRHVRMKILRPAGAEEIGEVEIPYYEGDRLKDVKAQTIRPDGTITKVEGKDFFEKSVEDWKIKIFSFPAADSGCIVEYTYRNFNNRYYDLKPWDFQSDIYTLESRFALTLYPGFTYSSSYSNVPVTRRDPVVTESVAPGDIFTTLKCFVWRMENLPPLVDEPYSGVEADYQSSLNYQLVSYKYPKSGYLVTYIEGWEDLGEEQDKFLRDYYSNGKVKPLLEPLIAGITDPLEKTRRIYEYVAGNFAAKADPLGHWLSHDNLNQMLKEGFGTPEEKNLMLVQMLREAGIQSWPVMISTRNHKRFNPEVFQIQQFNHIICYAQLDDSSGIYMDATTKYCPFGMLPPNSLVDGGFLIDGKQSQLVRVFYTDRRTYRLDETHMLIDSLGAARCSTNCSLTGYLASNYGRWSEEQSLDDFIDDYFLDKVGENRTLESKSLTADSTGRLVITFVYTVPEFARELDNNLVVKPVSYRFRENPFTREKRVYPIDFDFPYVYHNVVIIGSSRPMITATLPQQVTSAAPGITYKRLAQFIDGKVQLDAKLTITNDLLEPDAYPEVKKLFEDVAHASQDEVILHMGAQ